MPPKKSRLGHKLERINKFQKLIISSFFIQVKKTLNEKDFHNFLINIPPIKLNYDVLGGVNKNYLMKMQRAELIC